MFKANYPHIPESEAKELLENKKTSKKNKNNIKTSIENKEPLFKVTVKYGVEYKTKTSLLKQIKASILSLKITDYMAYGLGIIGLGYVFYSHFIEPQEHSSSAFVVSVISFLSVCLNRKVVKELKEAESRIKEQPYT